MSRGTRNKARSTPRPPPRGGTPAQVAAWLKNRDLRLAALRRDEEAARRRADFEKRQAWARTELAKLERPRRGAFGWLLWGLARAWRATFGG